MAFNVIQGHRGRYQLKARRNAPYAISYFGTRFPISVCDFLLVINSN